MKLLNAVVNNTEKGEITKKICKISERKRTMERTFTATQRNTEEENWDKET